MNLADQDILARCVEIQHAGVKFKKFGYLFPKEAIGFVEVSDRLWRSLFDEALDLIHYSRSCQRVGRCMRLAIVADGEWVGGIVLGSTFPNIFVRDEALGLRKYVTDYKKRGLKNPWSRENHLYWKNLQRVVNHARTFVFPQYQGKGIGISAHAELLRSGIEIWEKRYNDPVYALDTLCTADESKLFLRNNWLRAGQTKGYSADTNKLLSRAVGVRENPEQGIRNNVGLSKGNTQWWVWVIQIREFSA